MKVVLFCGGLGTRIREAAGKVPKPMVPLRKMPMLWHIMKYYEFHGHTDFVVCLGYRGDKIVNYFSRPQFSNWRIQFVETGLEATIGDRLRSVAEIVKNEPMFLANYGDGMSDVPLPEIIALNERFQSTSTFVAVRPHVSYHLVRNKPDGLVTGLTPTMSERINGGFFVMRPQIFDVLTPGDELVIEGYNRLIKQGKLTTFEYDGFWRSCDTLKDLTILEAMCKDGVRAPWELWDIEAPRVRVRRVVGK
jgi:glucose-1-phosphate cytidylyltransferase